MVKYIKFWPAMIAQEETDWKQRKHTPVPTKYEVLVDDSTAMAMYYRTKGIMPRVHGSQFCGHSRQGSYGVCQGIAMGSEAPTTPKRFKSPLTQNIFSNFFKSQVETQLFPINLNCPQY